MRQQIKTRKQSKRKRVDQKSTNRRQKRQLGGFLNRYDLVNQAAKVAPGVIKAATNYINNTVKDRIN